MVRVVLVHWNRDVERLAERLRKAGHDVEPVSPQGVPGLRGVRDDPPDAFVIDLERRPSDGREVGGSLRRLKATRHIPRPGFLAWVRLRTRPRGEQRGPTAQPSFRHALLKPR